MINDMQSAQAKIDSVEIREYFFGPTSQLSTDAKTTIDRIDFGTFVKVQFRSMDLFYWSNPTAVVLASEAIAFSLTIRYEQGNLPTVEEAVDHAIAVMCNTPENTYFVSNETINTASEIVAELLPAYMKAHSARMSLFSSTTH